VAVNLFNIDNVNGNINIVGDLSQSGAESYTVCVSLEIVLQYQKYNSSLFKKDE